MVEARFLGGDWHRVEVDGMDVRVEPDQVVSFAGDVLEERDDAWIVGPEGAPDLARALPKTLWQVAEPKSRKKTKSSGEE